VICMNYIILHYVPLSYFFQDIVHNNIHVALNTESRFDIISLFSKNFCKTIKLKSNKARMLLNT
jgi:hypothetical protein